MRPATPSRVAGLLGVGLLAAACGAAASDPPSPATTASAPAPASAVSSELPTPVATTAPAAATSTATPAGPGLPTQTDTEWGRIWDAVPSAFPLPVGASPAQADEPVSAVFDVPAETSETATFMQQALESARFSTLSMSGPFEDGSIVIESVGPESTDCLVQTTIAPSGDLTRMTVRYGAACPFS